MIVSDEDQNLAKQFANEKRYQLWTFQVQVFCSWVDAEGNLLERESDEWEEFVINIAAAEGANEAEIFAAARKAALRDSVEQFDEEGYTLTGVEYAISKVEIGITIDAVVGPESSKET